MVLLNTAKSYRVSAVGYEADPDHTTRQARYSAGLDVVEGLYRANKE